MEGGRKVKVVTPHYTKGYIPTNTRGVHVCVCVCVCTQSIELISSWTAHYENIHHMTSSTALFSRQTIFNSAPYNHLPSLPPSSLTQCTSECVCSELINTGSYIFQHCGPNQLCNDVILHVSFGSSYSQLTNADTPLVQDTHYQVFIVPTHTHSLAIFFCNGGHITVQRTLGSVYRHINTCILLQG